MDPHPKLRWPVPRHTAQLNSLASFASLVALTAFAAALPALAQTSSEPAVTGDVPMDDYLALLQQISPAAQSAFSTQAGGGPPQGPSVTERT